MINKIEFGKYIGKCLSERHFGVEYKFENNVRVVNFVGFNTGSYYIIDKNVKYEISKQVFDEILKTYVDIE